ncbi:MAG: hypothetical protein JJE36_04250 [Coriobacteriia bacterium]|nr:hypothetical protein [Coriobacteriia bacterium]
MKRSSAVICVASVFVLAAGALVGVSLVRKQDIEFKTTTAIGQVEQADKVIVRIDELLTSEADAHTPARIVTLEEDIAPAKTHLAQASAAMEYVKKHGSKKQADKARAIRASIDMRNNLLSMSPRLLEADRTAATSLIAAGSSWEFLNDGVTKANQALQIFSTTDKRDINVSRNLNKEAEKSFMNAKRRLQEAETAMPQADFSTYSRYLDTRIAMSQAASDADAYWMKNNLKEANKAIENHNKLSKKAVSIADNELKPLSEIIVKAYEEQTGTFSEQYFAARKKVALMDNQIR